MRHNVKVSFLLSTFLGGCIADSVDIPEQAVDGIIIVPTTTVPVAELALPEPEVLIRVNIRGPSASTAEIDPRETQIHCPSISLPGISCQECGDIGQDGQRAVMFVGYRSRWTSRMEYRPVSELPPVFYTDGVSIYRRNMHVRHPRDYAFMHIETELYVSGRRRTIDKVGTQYLLTAPAGATLFHAESDNADTDSTYKHEGDEQSTNVENIHPLTIDAGWGWRYQSSCP